MLVLTPPPVSQPLRKRYEGPAGTDTWERAVDVAWPGAVPAKLGWVLERSWPGYGWPGCLDTCGRTTNNIYTKCSYHSSFQLYITMLYIPLVVTLFFIVSICIFYIVLYKYNTFLGKKKKCENKIFFFKKCVCVCVFVHIFVNILLYIFMWQHWRNYTLLQCKVVSVQLV